MKRAYNDRMARNCIARAPSARGQKKKGGLLYRAHLGYAFDAPGYEPAAKPLVWRLTGAFCCGCALVPMARAQL